MLCTLGFLLVKAHLRPSPCDAFGYIYNLVAGFGGSCACLVWREIVEQPNVKKKKGAAVYCEVNFVVHN